VTTYCTILLAQDTRPEILAACIQADAALQAGVAQLDAALQAGMAQAAAATWAGYLTLGAGVFAVLAAFIGASVTLWATRKQIAANRAEQANQRSYDLKSALYAKAAIATATGLQVVVRIALLEIHPKDVLTLYLERLPDLFGVQLVGELPTISKFLVGVQHLGRMHSDLMKDRPFRVDGQYGLDERIEWSRKCTAVLSEVIKPLVPALVALRSELDMPIDGDEYSKIILAIIVGALENNERLYTELLARNTGA
jgi:hypothetical protein